MRSRPASSDGGFTFVEVVSAAFVLTLTVLGLSASLVGGSRLAESSREEMVARNALRDSFAQIADTPFSQVAQTHHRRGFDVPDLVPARDDPDGLPGEISFADGPAGTSGLYRVTARVRWRSAGGTREIVGVRFLANVRGDPGDAPTIAELEGLLAQGGR